MRAFNVAPPAAAIFMLSRGIRVPAATPLKGVFIIHQYGLVVPCQTTISVPGTFSTARNSLFL